MRVRIRLAVIEWTKETPTDVGERYKAAKAESAALISPVVRIRAPMPNRLGQYVEHGLGLRPAQAGIGDRHAVLERHARFQVLAARFEIAFDHHADDPVVTLR